MEQSNLHKTHSVMGWILKIVLPLFITVGLCFLLLTGVDVNELIEIIRRDCDFRWILLALGMSVFSHIIRAMRWQIQLDAIDCKTSLYYLTLSVFGTYAVNLVIPRLGEIWRSAFVAQRQKKPFATIFGSMVCERLADTVTVLLLTVVTFVLASSAIEAFLQKYPEVYQGISHLLTSPWVWCVAVAGILALVVLFRMKSNNPLIEKTRSAIKELWAGFAVIVKMKHKGRWLFLSLVLWGCYFLQNYVTFYAFPFTRELLAEHGMIVSLVCFVLGSIAMGIPSNGGIGPWQIAVIFGLGIYMPDGLDAHAAELFKINSTAYANLVMGSQTLLIILLGIFTFIAIAVSKKRINRQQ